MNSNKQKVNPKKQKKNALILCRDGNRFWTTQKQFWQWVRDGVIIKTGDVPLNGSLIRADEEKMIILANTILNLSCPNHMREALSQRRFVYHR